MTPDPYYLSRADEERRLASASADPRVRTVHLEMLARYAVLAGASPERTSQTDLVASLRQNFRLMAQTLETAMELSTYDAAESR